MSIYNHARRLGYRLLKVASIGISPLEPLGDGKDRREGALLISPTLTTPPSLISYGTVGEIEYNEIPVTY